MALKDSVAQEAICRLFSYADEHAHAIEKGGDQTTIRRHVDHFLLTHVAAVHNLIGAAGGGTRGPLLNAPSLQTAQAVPDLGGVVWAWEARNSVAHSYLDFLTGARYSGAFGGAPIGAVPLGGSDLPRLHGVSDESGVEIPVPNPYVNNPALLARDVLAFWRSAYDYVLQNPTPGDRYRYSDLWLFHRNSLTSHQ